MESGTCSQFTPSPFKALDAGFLNKGLLNSLTPLYTTSDGPLPCAEMHKSSNSGVLIQNKSPIHVMHLRGLLVCEQVMPAPKDMCHATTAAAQRMLGRPPNCSEWKGDVLQHDTKKMHRGFGTCVGAWQQTRKHMWVLHSRRLKPPGFPCRILCGVWNSVAPRLAQAAA